MDRSIVDRVLERYAEHHGVRVVAARDTGSRAWNLAADDSDHDVLVLFAQHPLEYATLSGFESSLDFTLENDGGDGDNEGNRTQEWECHGWNIRRFGELLVDSNPTAFEFLHSPLRYRAFEPLESLEEAVGDSFTPMALYHHYRSLAWGQYQTYLQGRLLDASGDLVYRVLEDRGEEYVVQPLESEDHTGTTTRTIPKSHPDYELARTDRTVKRHLYVARGVLYARFVRETHEFPTLDFPRFLEEVSNAHWVDPDFLERTRHLVERKRRGNGAAVVGRLFEPDEIRLPAIDPDEHAGRTIDRDRIDSFIRGALEDAFDSEFV